MNNSNQVFICFAAEDRYEIAEPIVYHLKNYGIEIWYDRYSLLLGDNRIEKNLNEGARQSKYAIAILSQHTIHSGCAMEELSIIQQRHSSGEVTVFPILYELPPDAIPHSLRWVKELIFKETNRHSGTREICNHIACKITGDILANCKYTKIHDIINANPKELPPAVQPMLVYYNEIDSKNLNSRITMLYAIYLTFVYCGSMQQNSISILETKIFKRLFAETRLNLPVDYREIWLLENAICLLVEHYLTSCTESKM